jgi:hypothetical protein
MLLCMRCLFLLVLDTVLQGRVSVWLLQAGVWFVVPHQ